MSDRYRVAYGRRVESFPRQCVFFGSTNKWDFLRDPTGNRRFWPMVVNSKRKTKNVFKDLTPEEVAQIWAEAYIMYKKGENLYLTPEIEAIAFDIQFQHSQVDDREGIVIKYLDTLLPATWEAMDTYQRRTWLQQNDSNEEDLELEGTEQRTRVCAAEIYCEALGGMAKDMTPVNIAPVYEILGAIKGWEVKGKAEIKGYGLQRVYGRVKEFEKKKLKPELN
jgi:hypothetical protein